MQVTGLGKKGLHRLFFLLIIYITPPRFSNTLVLIKLVHMVNFLDISISGGLFDTQKLGRFSSCWSGSRFESWSGSRFKSWSESWFGSRWRGSRRVCIILAVSNRGPCFCPKSTDTKRGRVRLLAAPTRVGMVLTLEHRVTDTNLITGKVCDRITPGLSTSDDQNGFHNRLRASVSCSVGRVKYAGAGGRAPILA